MALRDLLQGFGLEALDDETIEYMVSAVADAEDDEELTDILAPFLEDPAHLSAAIDAVKGSRASAPAPTAPAVAQPLQVPVSLSASTSTPAQPTDLSGGDGGHSADRTATEASNSGTRKKSSPKGGNKKRHGKGKNKVGNKEGVAAATGVIEVTSKLSRFDTEFNEQTFTGIDLDGVAISIDGRELLEGDLHLRRGRKYGLVGQNGCGKSTLLRAMADRRIPGWPQSLRVLLVEQEDVGDERTPVETVMAAAGDIVLLRKQEAILNVASQQGPDECRLALLKLSTLAAAEELRVAQLLSAKTSRMRGKVADRALVEREKEYAAAVALEKSCPSGSETDQEEVSQKLADVQGQLSVLDADALDSNARTILSGLGFSEATMNEPTSGLSGGWRMRVAIARALVSDVEVLLMDEPTNHLDWPALLWLENYLHSLEDVVLLIVSHDRAFLDKVATDIVRFSSKTFTYYHGNYSYFEDALEKEKIDRANYAAQMKSKVDAQWEKVRRLEAEGRKRNDAKMLNQVASMKKKLGVGTSHGVSRVGMTRGTDGKKFSIFSNVDPSTLDDGSKQVKEDDVVSWKLSAAEPLGDGVTLQCQQLQFGWGPTQPLSQKFDLDIGSRKIAILGANGSGKSTFLKTLAGELEPVSGEVRRNPRLRLAYFSQHVTDALNVQRTPVQIMKDRFPEASEQDIRGHLGKFGVRSIATTKLNLLSGGEKTRVSLAVVTYVPPHLLLLDEPTNHLDINTVQALSETLKSFGGGVVLVSHDRRLIEQLGCATMMLHGGKLETCTLKDFLRAMRKK